ncbi:MAG: pyruvate synthase subunit beta [Gemmatimonadetes bacterium]|nr:pyruvate synthase subunit beta [Gemmatimonadota bacterium]NIQ54705.1 pyruvate synthase subunit beta [Gemmatimonadota bacterium]NIU74910.1 pyruvate synthase subunit beta [Gammaproteobacteria bacterium]NIX44795.1 pyruvate synthase subunit beta [Gemmatimonadota bacterium]NIY09031.1 pyruvate synthase subunit beta [Gemmatimonadota bacterium]
MIKDIVPRRELLDSGHLACPGCGASLAMRMVLKELGEKTIVVLPACCWSIIAGPYPQSSLHVPLYHTAFETAGAVASGIRAALDVRGDTETTVMAWAGDGGTFDIGLQALSGAAERNEDFLYVCYDNEAYMNTGIQRSSATPWGAWTTTTPRDHPQSTRKKDILAIMAAHRVPYAATASTAYPEDLLAKVRKAKAIRGTRFLHILSPCPPGWKYSDEKTIEMGRMAVQNRVFPLLEVEDGVRWRFTVESAGDPVAPYIRAQGRFRHLTDAGIARIQEDVDARYAHLERMVASSP